MANLNMYYQNTRGLRTKTHTFKRNLQLNQHDVISLTETWLIDGINDSELFDERYLVWRRDRNYQCTQEKYGGGVLLAVRRDLMAIQRPEWSSSAEDIWITVTYKHDRKQTNIHFCTLYLCKENNGNSYNTQLHNFTDKLTLIINSYFNLANIDWISDGENLQPSGVAGETQINFIDALTECNLTQFNSYRNVNNRLLDLVLSNSNLSVIACDDPLVPEDLHHKSLIATLNLCGPEYLKMKSQSAGTTVLPCIFEDCRGIHY
ncbi:hypothetical protein ABMA28_003854 [Loxostege sticticalis]|uniref:Endonuclease/exonuclease/phosphatase domain-containing protein n=1 Tax=Loxostege sticticalis TaxID=481309 RepID=A0ABD0ST85_LOXSC